MLRFTFVPGLAPNLTPLCLVAGVLGNDFNDADFRFVGCFCRSDGVQLVAYQHHLTGRYLNLDQGGHAYRFLDARRMPDGWDVAYEPYADLLSAIADSLERDVFAN